jgi:hypothetical protein
MTLNETLKWRASFLRSTLMAFRLAAPGATEADLRAAMTLPRPLIDVKAAPPADPRAALNRPLAALNAKSEEELIALFS